MKQERLKEQKPDVVGVTCMSSTIKGALEAAELAKKAGAKVVIVPEVAAAEKFLESIN